MIAQHQFESYPATIPFRRADVPVEPVELLTVRDYYERFLRPDLVDLSPRSLDEDRIALNNWERYTNNRPLDQLSEEDLRELRDGMQASGRSPSTIQKTWRELRAMLKAAVDDDLLRKVPKLRRKSRLVETPPKRQRETISEAELAKLWECCNFASYPAGMIPAPKLWRVALVIFWTYGPRTLDVFGLQWSDIKFGDKLIQFEAMKTGKLQGLPITPTVEAQLRSIRQGAAVRGFGRVFPGFNSPGCFLKSKGKWKTGFRATWRREIFGRSGISQQIDLKHFRERAVTFYNGIFDGLGSWVAGHSVPGVTAQHYDNPTARIREAIEASPVPECFKM